MRRLKQVAAAGAIIFGVLLQPATANCQVELQYEPLVLPTADAVLCYDGLTTPGYYIDDQTNTQVQDPPFIIWLSDSPICAGTECRELCDGTELNNGADSGNICDGVKEELDLNPSSDSERRCQISRLRCTSTWWPAVLNPPEMLCRDDPFFGDFRRVYIPSCSLDWFLGKNNNQDPRNFRGFFIFNEIIKQLQSVHGLGEDTPSIIFGGTKGGGIGVLNLIKYLKSELSNNNILAIIDSSWILNYEKFLPQVPTPGTTQNLFQQFGQMDLFTSDSVVKISSSEWISGAELISSCRTKFLASTQLQRCLYPSELLENHINDEKVFINQGLFEIGQFENLEVLENEKLLLFEDETAYVKAASSFVEGYGESLRVSLERVVARLPGSSFAIFSESCASFSGNIVASSFPVIPPKEITNAGLEFSSGLYPYSLSGRKVNTKDLRTSLITFINSQGTSDINIEACVSIGCSNQCQGSFISTPATTNPEICEQSLIYYSFSLLVTALYFTFFVMRLQVLRFSKAAETFWCSMRAVEDINVHNNMDTKQNRQINEFGRGSIQLMVAYKNSSIKEIQDQLINSFNTGNYRRVHLMVEDLSYWALPSRRGQKPIKVVTNINISLSPGKVHALMGPSGSGKSTLLDLLALARTSGIQTGSHYINGVLSNIKDSNILREWLLNNQGYVRQMDVLFPRLTVREHLEHYAFLMLPQFMPAEEKFKRVWQFIRFFDLASFADTKCGDGGKTVQGGLSGGQRRRVSVATQLLNNPVVVLLDEPTSGLDSYSSLVLLERLNALSHRAGLNVILTIHQPRQEIFNYVDTLSILVKGQLVFSGKVDQAAKFFKLRDSINIGDELLDLLQGTSHSRIEELINRFKDGKYGQRLRRDMSREKTKLTPEVGRQLKDVFIANALADGRWSWKLANSSASMTWLYLSRSIRRGSMNVLQSSLYCLIAGTLIGLIFVGLTNFASFDSYKIRAAIVYLAVLGQGFLQGSLQLDKYLKEKEAFDREGEGMKSWVALLSSQTIRNGVTSTIEGLCFAVPLYLLSGLQGSFINYIIILLLVSMVTITLNWLIEIDRNSKRSAIIVQAMVLGIGALFNGFVIRLNDLPDYLRFLAYLNNNFWGLVGALINEIGNGFSFPCDERLSSLECVQRTGDNLIRDFDYETFNVFISIVVLYGMLLIFQALCVADFYLRYVYKTQRRLKRVENEAQVMDASELMLLYRPSFSRQRKPSTGVTMKAVINDKNQVKTTKMSKDVEMQDFYSDLDPESYPPENMKSKASFPDVVARIFTSRIVLTLAAVINICLAGFACIPSLVLVPQFLGVIFWTQFLVQLVSFRPKTIKGYGKILYAGTLDGPFLLLVIVDIALTAVSVIFANELQLYILLASVSIRMLMAWFFWQKVNYYHEKRARSFLKIRSPDVLQSYKKHVESLHSHEDTPEFVRMAQSTRFIMQEMRIIRTRATDQLQVRISNPRYREEAINPIEQNERSRVAPRIYYQR